MIGDPLAISRLQHAPGGGADSSEAAAMDNMTVRTVVIGPDEKIKLMISYR
jgi:hypothetical protein